MKIAFFDTKPYDQEWFNKINENYGFKIKYYEYKLNPDTAILAKDYDVVCAFVNDIINKETISVLESLNVKLIALRCAGFNNVDFEASYGKIHVVRVPEYSPYAVAEHAIALLMTINRNTHRAYKRTTDNNFSINGLLGFDMNGKTAGVIGTGKIGQIFINICKGFGMKVIAYDPYPNKNVDVDYVSLDELYSRSDIISLHCPLTKETYHIIDDESLSKMKTGVVIINTSRGGLIKAEDLIEYLKSEKVAGAGLDVYEEESEYFFEDKSNEILKDDILSRLLSFKNVVISAHQAFFTKEAIESIAKVTLENIDIFSKQRINPNEICYQCMNFGSKCNKKEGKKCF